MTRVKGMLGERSFLPTEANGQGGGTSIKLDENRYLLLKSVVQWIKLLPKPWFCVFFILYFVFLSPSS